MTILKTITQSDFEKLNIVDQAQYALATLGLQTNRFYSAAALIIMNEMHRCKDTPAYFLLHGDVGDGKSFFANAVSQLATMSKGKPGVMLGYVCHPDTTKDHLKSDSHDTTISFLKGYNPKGGLLSDEEKLSQLQRELDLKDAYIGILPNQSGYTSPFNHSGPLLQICRFTNLPETILGTIVLSIDEFDKIQEADDVYSLFMKAYDQNTIRLPGSSTRLRFTDERCGIFMLGTQKQWPNPDLTRRFSVVLGMQSMDSDVEIAIHRKQLSRPAINIPKNWGAIDMNTPIDPCLLEFLYREILDPIRSDEKLREAYPIYPVPFDATKSLLRQLNWLACEAPDLVEDWLLHRMALTVKARDAVREKLGLGTLEKLNQHCHQIQGRPTSPGSVAAVQ